MEKLYRKRLVEDLYFESRSKTGAILEADLIISQEDGDEMDADVLYKNRRNYLGI